MRISGRAHGGSIGSRPMADLRFGWTFEFLQYDPTVPVDRRPPTRYWSGSGDLTIGGNVHTGTGGLISIVAPDEAAGQPSRMTVAVAVDDADTRAILSRDFGPVEVLVRWIFFNASSVDPVWRETRKSFRGRLSAPVISRGEYRVDIESRISDIDRGRIVQWSHDAHIARHPGDRGMEYLKDYAAGVETKWPT